ncbi:peptidylprolyl isomerase [Pseudomonadota bacterium]
MTRFAWIVALLLGCLSPWSTVAAKDPTWREVDPDNLVFIELFEGEIAIELNPLFAPKTVTQFRKLVQDKFYDGLSFYRVIDGFVAQGGDGSDLGELSLVPLIDAEFELEMSEDISFTRAQKKDLFADETGFVGGFAAARDLSDDSIWLTHCPGVVAMARNDNPDSSRTDFYFVIGQAPRYLDRNMNVFARVVQGMDVVQQIKRGPVNENGIFQDDTSSSRIRRMRLASDIPKKERMAAFVMDTSSKGFEQYLKSRRDRKQKFFHHKPPEVLDICQVPVASRTTK